MRNKLIYFVLMGATLFFTIMYDSAFLPVLLIFEILLFLAMFLISLWLASGISVRMEIPSPVASKGEDVLIELFVKNKCWFPVNHFTLNLTCINVSHDRVEKEALRGAVQGLSEIRIACRTSSAYCGRIRVALGSIRIYDYMKLFSRIKRCEDKTYVNVLPVTHQVQAEVSERTRRFPVEGDEYEAHRSGDDPSEIYQVREFRNGDRMQRVHWKLSARTDELMTKEFSMPKGCKVLLLLNFYKENKKRASLRQMDSFLETAVSLSFGMVREECPHYVSWYDDRHACMMRKQVAGEEQFYEMVEELLQAVFYYQKYDLEGGYRANYPGTSFSTILELDERLQLLINQELGAVFTKEGLKDELEGYLLQV